MKKKMKLWVLKAREDLLEEDNSCEELLSRETEEVLLVDFRAA